MDIRKKWAFYRSVRKINCIRFGLSNALFKKGIPLKIMGHQRMVCLSDGLGPRYEVKATVDGCRCKKGADVDSDGLLVRGEWCTCTCAVSSQSIRKVSMNNQVLVMIDALTLDLPFGWSVQDKNYVPGAFYCDHTPVKRYGVMRAGPVYSMCKQQLFVLRAGMSILVADHMRRGSVFENRVVTLCAHGHPNGSGVTSLSARCPTTLEKRQFLEEQALLAVDRERAIDIYNPHG